MHGPELYEAQALGLGDKGPPEEGERNIFPTRTQLRRGCREYNMAWVSARVARYSK